MNPQITATITGDNYADIRRRALALARDYFQEESDRYLWVYPFVARLDEALDLSGASSVLSWYADVTVALMERADR